MGMDPVQWAFFIVQIVGDFTKLGIFVWLISGGWKFVLRTIGFDIDTLLVSFIGRVYEYFMQVLSSDMFNEKVLSELMQNIYVFVGVIMFFRLMMLVIKYLVNPDLVNDAKAGVNSLIQRVVIGCCGILFIPTIFDFALQLQRHVMEDNLIQQIVVPKDMLNEVEKKVDKGGQYIGTYVLAGFISPGENASKKTINEYKDALENGDLSSLSTLRKDGFLGGEYEYDYFFLLSTFCLCYVLYLMVKYTLDVITRFFRMLMYQMLAPVAMIEYMINGSDNGVFKTWKQGVLGTYFMLFIRVLALWFVVFVMVLMTVENDYNANSLLATDDYLLKALIIMALLGFMMDLPKLMGQVFGLDFEQEGNATGMLKQVGGMIKGAATAGLAIGGAAVGGALGSGKALAGAAFNAKGKNGQSLRDRINNSNGMQKFGNALGNNGLMKSMADRDFASHTKAASAGVIGAIMGSNQFTKAAYGGYSSQKNEHDKMYENSDSKIKSKDKEDLAETKSLIDRLDKQGKQVSVEAVAEIKLPDKVNDLTANINGEIAAVGGAKINAADVQNGTISPAAEPELRSAVEQVVTRRYEEKGHDTELPAVQQKIQQQVDQIMGSAVANVDQTGKVTLEVDSSAVASSLVGMGNQNIVKAVAEYQSIMAADDVPRVVTRQVNDVQGTQLDSPGPATRVVNDVQGSQVSGPGQASRVVNDVQGSQISGPGQVSRVVNDVQGSQVSGPGQVSRVVNDVQGSQVNGPGQVSRVVNDVQGSQVSGLGPATRVVDDVQGSQLDGVESATRTVEINGVHRHSMESDEPAIPPHLDSDRWDA